MIPVNACRKKSLDFSLGTSVTRCVSLALSPSYRLRMRPKVRTPPTRWNAGDVRKVIGRRGRLVDRRPDSALITMRERLSLVCHSCGYAWASSREALAKGRWCPRCTGSQRWTYARARRYAKEHGGRVESNATDETNCGSHVPMMCSEGHKWRMPRKSFDADSWCPECAKRRLGKHPRKVHSVRDVRALIKSRGRLVGDLLDGDTVPHTRRLTVECLKCKHQWVTRFGILHRGGGCPSCAGNRRWTMGRVREIAEEKGGSVVSDLPDDATVKVQGHVKIRCANGHEWDVRPTNLQAGYWCPGCCGRSVWTIGRIRAIVEERGGYLLSRVRESTAITAHQFTFRVRCAVGHVWTTNTSRLPKHWCGECAGGQGEEVCRAYMEALFGKPFPRSRPDFLKHTRSGRNLELDGYCADEGVAFEHHGLQHYASVSFYRDNHITLDERQRRDRLKRRRCRSRGIVLVEIPELHLKTPLAGLRHSILSQCASAGRRVPFPDAAIDTSKLMALSSFRVALEKAHAVAAAKGGECLSTVCGTDRRKAVMWRCAKGHEWKASISRVVNGVCWCPQCGIEKTREATRGRLGWYQALEKCQAYARSRGGECLSEEYCGVRHRLQWRCAFGHVFSAEPFQLLPKPSMKGKWCWECRAAAARKASYTRLAARCRDHAKSLGGECLSNTVDGYRSPVKWRCSCGYEWSARPGVVFGSGGRRGTWCMKCRRAEAELKRQRTVASKRSLAAVARDKRS